MKRAHLLDTHDQSLRTTIRVHGVNMLGIVGLLFYDTSKDEFRIQMSETHNVHVDSHVVKRPTMSSENADFGITVAVAFAKMLVTKIMLAARVPHNFEALYKIHGVSAQHACEAQIAAMFASLEVAHDERPEV